MPAERPLIRDLTPGAPAKPAEGARLVGPHSEGARVLLECETSGGYPAPSLSWWRDGKLIDDSYELVSVPDGLVLERRAGWDGAQRAGPDSGPAQPDQEEAERAEPPEPAGYEEAPPGPSPAAAVNRLIRNRLELAAVTRDDLLANYSCAAWNSRLGAPPTSYVMIDMNRKYPN